jgi:hypothetical protein
MRIPKVSRSKTIIFGITILVTLSLVYATYSELSWQYSSKHGRTFVGALGYQGLSIPSECLSSRNPLLEPICLPDIPGGYCYHESCGKVGTTYIGKNYTLEVFSP